MSAYDDALSYMKNIESYASELRSSIINYKKSVNELQQVVNTMYDKDYNTSGAEAKKARMAKAFKSLNSCKFRGIDSLDGIKVTISIVDVKFEKSK